MSLQRFHLKTFLKITLITTFWVQVSETFRYLILVVPIMNSDTTPIPETTVTILVIWFFWGTLLASLTVLLFWMFATIFGNTTKTVFQSATISWLFFFVLFWVGSANMGLADWSLVWITLPLSWLELLVATFIASKLYKKRLKTQMV